MFNIKWGVISGGTAFVLALLVGLLVGHVGFPIALLRGLGFAVLFFALGVGAWALINAFIPDLLRLDARDDLVENVFATASPSGSQVNITVDDNTVAIPPSGEFAPEPSEVGNFSEFVSGAEKSMDVFAAEDIDQMPKKHYTEKEDLFSTPSEPKTGEFSMNFGAFVADNDEAAETGSLMDSFSTLLGDSNAEGDDYLLLEQNPREDKASKYEGDFNPKDIAAGLRTVLDKDNKRG